MLQLLYSFWWLLFYASIPVAIYALNNRSWQWMLGSAVMYLPFVWYLNATPPFEGALLIMLFYLLTAGALFIGRSRIAWALWFPIPIFTIWVIFVYAVPPRLA